MWIGLEVWRIKNPPLILQFILVVILFLGVQKSKTQFLATEAKYRVVANTMSEVLWLRNLLCELGVKPIIPILWCDNLGVTSLTVNLVYHSHMKHIQIDLHFAREKVTANEIQVCHISTKDQTADVLTKPLTRIRFQDFRNKLTISSYR